MLKSPGRSALTPVIYGGVVLLLVLLALFTRGFSQNVGDARLSGRYSVLPLFSSHELETLTLTWNGISLRFSRRASPALKGFQSTETGTDIVFDGNVRLQLAAGSDLGGSVSLASSGAASLAVPFTVEGVLQEPPAGAALAWKRAGRQFVLTLPSGAKVDPASGLLTLPAGGAAWAARFERAGIPAGPALVRASPARARAPETRLPDEASLPTAETMQAALGRFADSAYAGWTGSRYSAAQGQWLQPDGKPAFSEDIGVGLLAESIARGTWQTILPLWTDSLAQQQQRVPGSPAAILTSSYVGGVRDFLRALQPRTAEQVQQAGTLIASADNAALSIPGLIPLLLDHGTPELLTQASVFLKDRPVASLDVGGAIGLLEGLLDYARDVQSDEALTRRLRDVIDHRILASVRQTSTGIFLLTGSGKSDVPQSLRCGILLLRAGPLLDATLPAAIGRGLITSCLALADEKGFLPATLTIDGSRVSARDGGVTPEAVYSLLPLDRFVPRETSLAKQLGPGGWTWTSARLVSAEGSTATGVVLVFGYPPGIPYHMVLRGVRSFTQIKLHGIPWHADPSYARYSDGWAYDSGTQTLSMKITGRADREEIDIFF